MYEFFKAKTTSNYSFYPFSAIFANATACSVYGFFSGNNDMIICNIPGAILGIIFHLIYWKYCDNDKWKVSILLFILITIILSGLTVALSFISTSISSSIFGILLNITGLIQYGSPLVKMYDIIKTKSSNGLALPLTIGTIFCSSSWTLYSSLHNDIYLLIINIIGLLLGITQALLFCIYPSKENDNETKLDLNKELINENIKQEQEQVLTPISITMV